MSYVFINALGISELLSRILAAAGSVDYLVFSCLAYFVIERYGRRKVMMTSAAACCLCWVVITIVLSISDTGRGDEYKLGIVAVSFFFVFFASFGMGVLGVPWLYPTEINALEMRTKGASVAMATNWIMVCIPIPFKYSIRGYWLPAHIYSIELHGRPSNTPRNRKPRMEILDYLGCYLFLFHPSHVPLLPGNCKPHS